METAVIIAISELAKLGLTLYAAWMRQAGLNEEQIDKVFQEAKKGLLDRDPAKLPE